MTLTDIIGPVMVGPSSSHTAGAARIGKVAYKLLGERVVHADVFLHGSFATTGRGHGTDRALLAGLMGFKVDDPRIPDAFALAEDAGMTWRFGVIDLGSEAHPNSVLLKLKGESGKELSVVAASVGGARIHVTQLDGLAVSFSGDLPTIIIHHIDQPGKIAEVASLLERKNINVASMRLYRAHRGGHAVMVFECDSEIAEEDVAWLAAQEATVRVIYLSQARK